MFSGTLISANLKENLIFCIGPRCTRGRAKYEPKIQLYVNTKNEQICPKKQNKRAGTEGFTVFFILFADH